MGNTERQKVQGCCSQPVQSYVCIMSGWRKGKGAKARFMPPYSKLLKREFTWKAADLGATGIGVARLASVAAMRTAHICGDKRQWGQAAGMTGRNALSVQSIACGCAVCRSCTKLPHPRCPSKHTLCPATPLLPAQHASLPSASV